MLGGTVEHARGQSATTRRSGGGRTRSSELGFELHQLLGLGRRALRPLHDVRQRQHRVAVRGARVVEEFFTGPLETALEPGELLTAIELPPLPADSRTAFAEYAPTHGSFASAGVAVVRAPGHAAIALLGTGSHPIRAAQAEEALRDGRAREAAELAASEIAHPHRRALVAALAREAIDATAPPRR